MMHWIRKVTNFALPLLAATCLWAQAVPQPVNANASPEARALLGYFYAFSGQYTLTGQHNYPLTIARWTDRTLDLTGKMPAIYGQDFGFQGGEDKDSVLARPAMIAEAKRQYELGAIPTLTWHSVRPTSDEPVTFKDDVQGKLTNFEWEQLLTPGTEIHKRWEAQVDVIAGYLAQLQAAHVPVLMRPYHEMNGDWFWWCARKGEHGSAALYRMFYDRMVNVHHLNNLVWVWNVNTPDRPGMEIENYYPGSDVVDILSLDNYGEFKQSHYDKMLKLAAGKPIALGEVGHVPSPEVLKQQPRWTYFMVWSEFIEDANPLPLVMEAYNSPQTASRDDARMKAGVAAVHKASASWPKEAQPVTAEAQPVTKVLLAKLYENRQILSGNGQAPEVRANGKVPEVVAVELTDAKDADKLTAMAKEKTAGGGIVLLKWKPVSPTGSSKLTETEWKELLTPGTDLNKVWLKQVSEAAATLQALQSNGIAVLFAPLPESNGKMNWWANRPGIHGSSELYRQLFVELTAKQQLKNLLWVWLAAPAPGWPDASGQYADYFPGLLYVDTLAVEASGGNWGRGRDLSILGVSKPVLLNINGNAATTTNDQNETFNWLIVQIR